MTDAAPSSGTQTGRPCTDLLELRSSLSPVLGSAVPRRMFWDGPRRWWGGPLDVEALALGAAGAVIEAVDALGTDSRPGEHLRTTSQLVAGSFDSIAHLRVAGTAPTRWAPMSGFHPTADGWIRVHANYPHHARSLLDAMGVDQPDRLTSALREVSSDEAERMITEAGGVAAAVGRPRPMSTEPGAWIEFATARLRTSPVRRSRPPWSSRSGLHPLRDVRVLDLTRVLAGPTAGKLLGLLGADVLRVDPPHVPELLDAHIDTGFDKRSAFADLRESADRAEVRTLLGDADVVLLGYRPGALTSFGLDPGSLRTDFPDLLVVSVSAWDPHGRLAGRRGFDSIVQAASGISHLYGGRSGNTWRPGSLPVQALDYTTGFGMAAAGIALLASRTRGTVGTAHLSLERTANLLLSACPVSTDAAVPGLHVPLRHTLSGYGRIEYAAPPFIRGGHEMDHLRPPVPFGSSALEWQARPAT